MLRDSTATVGESGPQRALGVPFLHLQNQGLGEAAMVLFVSYSSPHPNLAGTGQGSYVSGRG